MHRSSYEAVKRFRGFADKAGLKPVYLPHVLCSHLGVDRHGGVDL